MLNIRTAEPVANFIRFVWLQISQVFNPHKKWFPLAVVEAREPHNARTIGYGRITFETAGNDFLNICELIQRQFLSSPIRVPSIRGSFDDDVRLEPEFAHRLQRGTVQISENRSDTYYIVGLAALKVRLIDGYEDARASVI